MESGSVFEKTIAETCDCGNLQSRILVKKSGGEFGGVLNAIIRTYFLNF